ncbi:MAG: ACT domain-containing protein [Phormidesmis sp. CAN_BIN44]|nr:ACT domain-containing protein [Phormidesmis sp. CAN_BIN44]
MSDRPGKAARVFQLLAEQSISVDMIVQSQRRHITDGRSTRDIAFTLPEGDVDVACRVLGQAAVELENAQIEVNRAIAKVSIVSSNLSKQSSAFQMFTAIATHQINIRMIAISALKVSCVVSREQGAEALQAVHAAFGLAGHHKIKVPA